MNRSLLTFLGVLVLVALPGVASAADFFLQVEGVDGESTDSDHRNWIELESWSFGVSNSGAARAAGGGGGAGRTEFQPLVFRKRIDKSSPVLFQRSATGQHIRDVTLSCVARGRREEYLVIKLSDVMVTSYQVSGEDGATEVIVLSFARVEYRTPATAVPGVDGSVRFDAARLDARMDAVAR